MTLSHRISAIKKALHANEEPWWWMNRINQSGLLLSVNANSGSCAIAVLAISATVAVSVALSGVPFPFAITVFISIPIHVSGSIYISGFHRSSNYECIGFST